MKFFLNLTLLSPVPSESSHLFITQFSLHLLTTLPKAKKVFENPYEATINTGFY